MIRMTNIEKRFGKRILVEKLTFEFGPGIHCLIARNGSGKSTLLKICAGVDREFEGSLSVLGQDARICPDRTNQVRTFLPDEPEFYRGATAFELVHFLALTRGFSASELISFGRKRFDLGSLEKKPLQLQSLGERKRSFLTALLHPSIPIWLMDEPSNGLDPHYRAALEQTITEHRERGGCVLIATHDMSFADSLGAAKYRLEPVDRVSPVTALTPI